jgi:hypothetical protein
MKRYLTFFFILLAGLAGLVSVPRCYVMEPDCPERGSLQCPRLADAGPAAVNKATGNCCALATEDGQQESPPMGAPGGKVARFKVDQYLPSFECLVDPPAEVFLPGTPAVALNIVSSFLSGTSRRQISVHPPPLSVLLQKQSFLI